MTDAGKFGNRIPFEEIESFSSWKLPTLNDAPRTVSSTKRPAPKRGKVAQNGHVEDLGNQMVHPMTAQQLQEITREAEREGREQGYQDGYQEGLKAGESKGTKQGEQKAYEEHRSALTERMARLAELIEALHEPVQEQDQVLENLLVDMAVNFAEHLINKELNEDPSSVFHLVQQAVSSLPTGVDNIRLYLHPDDVELVHEAFANQGRDWRVSPDEQMSRGGCRVESKQSLVDFSIKQRIAQMLEQVNFQGDIDPETLPPIEDFRPQPAASEAPTSEERERHESEVLAGEPAEDLSDDPPDELPADSSEDPPGGQPEDLLDAAQEESIKGSGEGPTPPGQPDHD